MPTIRQLHQCLEWAELSISSENGKKLAELFFSQSKSRHEIDEIISMAIHDSKIGGNFSRKPMKAKLWNQHAKLIKLAINAHGPLLSKIPYQEFLKTPYWAFIRMAKILEAEDKCERCRVNYTLQVHHLTYDFRGNDHKRMDLLVVLCDACHKKAHNL